MRRFIGAAFAALATVAIAALPAPAQAQGGPAAFYKGRTVTIVIGAKGGTLYIAGQIMAQHLGKYIPGNPNVILQSVPGGAHLAATNSAYNVNDAEGLTILAANPNVAMGQLAKLDQVKFDLRKFEWLGSLGPDGAMFSIRADLPYKTWAELKASGKEIIVGSTGPGSNAHDMPLLLKEFAGLNARIVGGYAANSDILLAVERKEVDAWAALGSTIKNGVERGAVRALVRARAPVAGFNDLPIDENLATDPIGKSLMAIRGIPLSIGRVFGVRPGVPAERVAALREAVAKVATDPDARAQAAKANIDIDFIGPEKVKALFDELFNQPPNVLEAMGKYIKPGE